MKFLKQNNWLLIIYGVLLIAIGVVTVVLSITNIDWVDSALSIAFAVGLFIVGALNIATSLITNTDRFFTVPLLLGSICIAFGVVLCINRDLLGSFIIYLLGTLLLALALVFLIKGILFIVYKQKVTWIICEFVLAALCIAGGILVLCFRNESKLVFYIIIGSIITLVGIITIIFSVRNLIMLKKCLEKEDVVDEEIQSGDA